MAALKTLILRLLGRWTTPKFALAVSKLGKLPDERFDPAPWVIYPQAHSGDELAPALQHWSSQGVHLVLAVRGPESDHTPIPDTTTVRWYSPPHGAPEHAVLQFMADQVARWSGTWVIPAAAHQRWFAPATTIAEHLESSPAQSEAARVYDVHSSAEASYLDKTRRKQLVCAFRTNTATVVGPNAEWVRSAQPGPTSNELRILQLGTEPPRGRTIAIDWPHWRSWDPADQVGTDVVSGSNVPGAGAHQRSHQGPWGALRTPVIMAPEWMGFGNLLYLLNIAHNRDDGTKVLLTPALDRWIDTFPELGELALRPADVSWRHHRENPMKRTYGAFGQDFTSGQLTDFVRRRLVPSMVLDRLADPELMVINIRRGDYYSEPDFQECYGFDQVAYGRTAMTGRDYEGSQLKIVSDEVAWCRSRLGWLEEIAPVSFADPTAGPQADFRAVASAHHLIITNSTFSYWAAHVSNVWHLDMTGVDNKSQVIAPWFFSRAEALGHAYQVDPEWTIVKDIPGGWNGSIGEPA